MVAFMVVWRSGWLGSAGWVLDASWLHGFRNIVLVRCGLRFAFVAWCCVGGLGGSAGCVCFSGFSGFRVFEFSFDLDFILMVGVGCGGWVNAVAFKVFGDLEVWVVWLIAGLLRVLCSCGVGII